MCSISGFSWEDSALIKQMNEILTYRGPDDTGIYIDKDISLGHNRLSIIDLSKAGHQPMPNKEKTLWIIYNGEVYNFKEIREILEKKSYIFESKTDTEVILKAYEEFGPNCLEYFNGMFAFAIWDLKKKEIFLARDRLGIKPLYYRYFNGNLIFSSEIKAIMLHNFKKELDFQCFNSYLTYRFIPSNKTMIKGIKKLLPGHYALFKNNKLIIRKYWALNWEIDNKPEAYYLSTLKNLLFSSVEYSLISDVPLGVFISGGVDSGLIAAINRKLRKEPVKTFTVGFGHETDEFNYAKIVSDYLETDHHELILDYSSITRKLPTIIWQMDEPHSETTIVPLYFLSEFAKKKVTVVNTGEGADEFLSGYQSYYLGANMFRPIPDFIKKKIYLWYYSPFKKNERKKLLKYPINQDNSLKLYLNSKNKYPEVPRDLLNKMLFFDIQHEMTNWELNRTDKLTMIHSMEARVPYLDHRIAELCTHMPIKYKQPNLNGKYILKKLALSFLPREIVLRKKQGFTVPMHTWVKDSLEDVAEAILFNNKKDFLNYIYIKQLISKHKNSKKTKPFQLYSFQLLMILFFDIWYEMYFNNRKQTEIEKILRF